jgi:hypothetical protein
MFGEKIHRFIDNLMSALMLAMFVIVVLGVLMGIAGNLLVR